MGQAKQRGTFEERKAAAIARNEADAARKQQADIERRKARELIVAETPEERRSGRRTAVVLTSAMGIASSSIAIMNADDLARRR